MPRFCVTFDLPVEATTHEEAAETARVNHQVAVAYICKHFEQGTYSGWDGWIEMREADAR